MTAAGMLTLTPRVTGQTIVTVTATADGESVSDEFTVDVMAGSRPAPPAPVAPTKTAIPDQMLYQADGAQTIDLSMYFTHENAITYAASSSPTGVVRTAVTAAGMLTLTPRVEGQTVVTVTATADGESVSDEFIVTVRGGSEPADPDPDPDPMGPVPTGTIGTMNLMLGEEPETVDVDTYFDGEMLSFKASSSKDTVATASADGSVVTVTPKGVGTARITVTATDDDMLTATQMFDVRVSFSYPENLELMMEPDDPHELTVLEGHVVEPVDPAIVSAARKNSTTYTLTVHQKMSTSLEVYDANQRLQATIEVTVTNRAPKFASELDTNTVYTLAAITEATTFDADDEKALGGRSESDLYVLQSGGSDVDLDTFFDDPDQDEMTYELRSGRQSHAVVAGVKKDGSAVYVEMIDDAIAHFTIIVKATDDDADNPLSAPELALTVRTMPPLTNTYVVKQDNFNLSGLKDGRKVAFRDLAETAKDTLTFEGGIQFFKLVNTDANIEYVVDLDLSNARAADYVQIEHSKEIISFSNTAADFATDNTDTTLMFRPLKPGNAWIKITYHEHESGAASTDDAVYKKPPRSQTLRFTVAKVVENVVVLE